MKNTSIEKEKIRVDFSRKEVPSHVKNFMPDVYRDGDHYLCMLGIGDEAITGMGSSIRGAMVAWEKAYSDKQKTSK